jgi:diguanylate cyclase (GGDEF)-like protein
MYPQNRWSDHRSPAFARRFGLALRRGDGDAAQLVIEDALGEGIAPDALHCMVIEPAMVHIGELWSRGTLSVADEHLATTISQRVLLRLFAALDVGRPRSRERVLLAAVEGQRHVLGLRMVADVLEGAGFDVLFLGADVPVSSLSRFVTRYEPAVAGLALGVATGGGNLAASIRVIQDAAPDCRIMLGGRGVPLPLRESDSPYPTVARSLDAVSTVERLLLAPPARLSPVVDELLSPPGRPWAVRPQAGAEIDLDLETDPSAARLADAAQETAEVARGYIRLVGAYRELAFTDPVTDLPNRRAYEERLLETGDGMLLAIDIDSFKAVNDKHGHAAGDLLLRQVGQAIARSIRSNDFAARVGGDEFAVVLPFASVETARELSRRIAHTVGGLSNPAVTASIGIAPMTGDRRASRLAADSALYEAKSLGRDRIVESSQIEPI